MLIIYNFVILIKMFLFRMLHCVLIYSLNFSQILWALSNFLKSHIIQSSAPNIQLEKLHSIFLNWIHDTSSLMPHELQLFIIYSIQKEVFIYSSRCLLCRPLVWLHQSYWPKFPIPLQVHRACKYLVVHLSSKKDPANPQEHCNW